MDCVSVDAFQLQNKDFDNKTNIFWHYIHNQIKINKPNTLENFT